MLGSLLGLLLIVGSAIFGIRAIQTHSEKITENVLPSVEALAKLSANYGRMRALTSYMAMAENDKSLSEKAKLYNDLKTEFNTVLAKYMKEWIVDEQDKKNMEAIQREFTTFEVSMSASMDLSVRGQFKQAQDLVTDNFKHALALQLAIQKALETNDEYSIKEKLVIKEAIKQTFTQFLIIVAIAGLAIVLFNLYIARSILLPTRTLQAALAKAAKDNDLTVNLGEKTPDEIGNSVTAVDHFFTSISQSLSAIAQSSSTVVDSTRTLSTIANRSKASSNTLKEASTHMATAVEELSTSIATVSSIANESKAIANASDEQAKQGVSEIQTLLYEIKAREQSTLEAAKKIAELDQNATNISTIVNTIQGIASQTNLLALNAAIEAARAGESGRGFAVVADEVRKLAEQTRVATVEIAGTINTMIEVSQATANDARNLATKAQEDTAKVENFQKTITSIAQSFTKVNALSEQISVAMSEQAQGSILVARQVETVAEGARQANSDSQDIAQSSEQLSLIASQVQATIQTYKTR